MRTRLSCYDTVLLTLLRFNYATRKSLMLLDFSDAAIYMAIQRGEREKTIATSPLRYRRVKSERRHSTTYMTITVRGIRYLVDNCSRHIDWLKYLPSDLSRVRIRGYRCATSQVERFLRMSAAAQAAESIGAAVQPLYLSTDRIPVVGDEKNIKFSTDIDISIEDDILGLGLEPDDMAREDIEETYVVNSGVSEANKSSGTPDTVTREPQCLLSTAVYEAMERAGNRDLKESHKVVFHPVREVKARLSATIGKENTSLAARDLMSCRYSGLLESCYNNVLMYVPNAMGMDWRERIVRKELATQASFAKLYSQFGPVSHNAQNGVVLVQSEKMLEDIYFDKRERRRTNEILGRSFNHYYVVAYNKDGMSDLERIMGRNLEVDERRVIDSAVRSGVYERNFAISAKLFPLQTVDGIIVANGTLMDLIKIHAIESLANHIPDLRYGILCHPHQLTYYQRIMPRAYFMLVE